jgi:hypothetical protein
MKNNGRCQPVIAAAMIAVATSGVRFAWRLACAKPRKLGSSLNGPPKGSIMFMPIASAIPYHGVN